MRITPHRRYSLRLAAVTSASAKPKPVTTVPATLSAKKPTVMLTAVVNTCS